MFVKAKFWSGLVALICIVRWVDDKQCISHNSRGGKEVSALTAKAYPPRVIGNPAAGSTKGTGQAQRDYFNKCVANGGNMDDQAGKEAK